MHFIGHGYLVSHVWLNFFDISCAVLSFTLTNSVKLVTGSMIVRALKVTSVLPIFTSQGPIKSTATSSKGCSFNYLSGSNPYPFPGSLCF